MCPTLSAERRRLLWISFSKGTSGSEGASSIWAAGSSSGSSPPSRSSSAGGCVSTLKRFLSVSTLVHLPGALQRKLRACRGNHQLAVARRLADPDKPQPAHLQDGEESHHHLRPAVKLLEERLEGRRAAALQTLQKGVYRVGDAHPIPDHVVAKLRTY